MSAAPSRLYSPLEPLAAVPQRGAITWSGLYGGAQALAVTRAAESLGTPVVVLAPDSRSVERFEEEIGFYNCGSPQLEVLSFPNWETLPYDQISPYQDITSARLYALSRLPSFGRGIVILAVQTLLHRLPPSEFVAANSFCLARGQRLHRTEFCDRLILGGYRHVGQVLEHGDFAVRGSLIDVYPMGSRSAFRIDLFDDDIESLREFDAETQRSTRTVDTVTILPAREFALDDASIARFRAAWRQRFPENPRHCPVYEDVSNHIAPAGIEYYLPLFFERTDSFFDYLNGSECFFVIENARRAAEEFWSEARRRYDERNSDVTRPLLAPEEIFIDPEAFAGELEPFRTVELVGLGSDLPQPAREFSSEVPVRIPVDPRAQDPLANLRRFAGERERRTLIVAESGGRRETILDLFRARGLAVKLVANWQEFCRGDEAGLALTVAPLEQGLQLREPRIAVVTETQLFGERVVQRRRRRRAQRDPESIIRDLSELALGAPVVHEEHGVGRYRGLETLQVGDIASEFICVEYADEDKLYVPVGALHLISRYTGLEPDHAPLHKLGSGQWERIRSRAAKRIRDIAAELLDVYARRAARRGHGFCVDRSAYQAFAAAFPFEETPDQEAAIAAVITDMERPQPMDRLVCGDSGFGKTEVAMRAAFVAVMDGRQVAVLVPTTLLAQQHFQTFKDRFADWPVRVEQLSRFRTGAEQEAVLKDLAGGRVDILIGTHKLLQRNIDFKKLGLLVIDEEHRFGVRQKERLKALRADVDILTLTATPIPRTLNLSLSGVRDLSLIATPPSRRLAVKTFVHRWNDDLLREAILREINRGGQVYFVHNQVESIEEMCATVAGLVPEARVRFAHGQMRERELERVMSDFYHRRFNLLVCTTIIETGIDVPSANTMIVNRAHRFGLAQLYQLRGRVGRSHHRAYAFLLVPARQSMSADAVKRLEAIESLEELGIGFTLATHDLEIRGAGEILGDEQSGHIDAIGFGLYTELLARAVTALKAGKEPDLVRPMHDGVEIDLHVSALITEDYLPDVHTRLVFYKRIAGAADRDALDTLREEMIDRFGPLPEATRWLFRVAEMRLQATAAGVRRIDVGANGGRLLFTDKPDIDPRSVVKLIERYPESYRIDEGRKLVIRKPLPQIEDRFAEVIDLLNNLKIRDAA